MVDSPGRHCRARRREQTNRRMADRRDCPRSGGTRRRGARLVARDAAGRSGGAPLPLRGRSGDRLYVDRARVDRKRRSSAGPVDRNPRCLAGDLRLRLEAWPDPLFLLASRCGVRRRADDDGADRISGRHRDLRRVGGAARRRAVDLQRARDRVAHRRAAVDVRRRGARARPDRAQADAGVLHYRRSRLSPPWIDRRRSYRHGRRRPRRDHGEFQGRNRLGIGGDRRRRPGRRHCSGQRRRLGHGRRRSLVLGGAV